MIHENVKYIKVYVYKYDILFKTMSNKFLKSNFE